MRPINWNYCIHPRLPNVKRLVTAQFSGILISHIHPAAVDRETDIMCPRYHLVFFSTQFEVHTEIHNRSNGGSSKIGQVFLRSISKGS